MEIGHRRKERLDRGVKVRTEGLYALMSWRELGYLTMPRLVLIIGMLILPLVMPSMYWQRVISIVCIYALLSLSFVFFGTFCGTGLFGRRLFHWEWWVYCCHPKYYPRITTHGIDSHFDLTWCGYLYTVFIPLPSFARGILCHNNTYVSAVAGPSHRGAGHTRRN